MLKILYQSIPLLFGIVAIVWLLVFIFTKNYKRIRGKAGEYWVNKELEKLPISRYMILNNVMLQDLTGTHQIDHIVFSKYGIFVIEMKNFYGLITGNQYSDQWCQYLHGNKFYFNNPIHQNYGHIQALKKILALDEKCFVPIICFSNQAKLKINSNTPVVQVDTLAGKILSYEDEILSSINLIKIKDTLSNMNITDSKQRNNHVNEIHKKLDEKNNKIDNGICPKCGGHLVERNGKYSKFIGCSNYPKCRFSKHID